MNEYPITNALRRCDVDTIKDAQNVLNIQKVFDNKHFLQLRKIGAEQKNHGFEKSLLNSLPDVHQYTRNLHADSSE